MNRRRLSRVAHRRRWSAAWALVPLLALLPSTGCSSRSLSGVPPVTTATRAAGFEPSIAAARPMLLPRLERHPGLSVAVAVDGRLVWAEGLGWANLETREPARADTPYRLYSVAKPITATLALRLAEQGRVDLDRPVYSYAHGLPPTLGVLTLRQLLAHTSGLRDYRSGEWLPVSRVHCGTAREALAPFRDDPLLFTPGTSARYTSYGYVLASAVLEEHAGRPFYELLKSEVLAPSGATGLRPDSPADEAPTRSAYYEAALFGRVRPAVAVDNSCKLGAGGLLGSVTDLAAFGTALLGGRLLSPAGLAEMLRPVAVSGGETTDSGLGLSLAQPGGATVGVQSGGAIGGRSYLLLDPQRHVVIALASNLEGERLGEEARRLHAAFSGR